MTLNSGSTLKIPVKVSGLPKPSVTWSKDEKPVRSQGRLTLDIGDKATTLTLKKVTREDDGLYSVLAENEAGQATAKFDIEVIGETLKLNLDIYFMLICILEKHPMYEEDISDEDNLFR